MRNEGTLAMGRRVSISLLAVHAALYSLTIDGFSYAPWAPTPVSVAPMTTFPVSARPTTSHQRNPLYPDLPLDKYLGKPFFQKINTDYPGLQLIHEDPFIFIVNNFLTNEECDRLVRKAMTGNNKDTNLHNGEGTSALRPQVGGGAVVRTSSGVVCENGEVPAIHRKMSCLANVSDRKQLQPLKISRYSGGDEFSKHTDAWPTPGGRGWVNENDFLGDFQRPMRGCLSSVNQPFHNHFMTRLVYLNDVPFGRDGSTTFTDMGLHTGVGGKKFSTSRPHP